MKKLYFTVLLTFMSLTHYGQTWDLEDYSSYSSAASHVGINYPANWSKAEYYPDFSWDVIPQHLTFKSGQTLSNATYQKATNYSLIDVNGSGFGFNTWDEGMWYANAKLKSYNPNLSGSFYLNLQIVFPFYLHTAEFFNHPEWATGEKLRDYDMYNHDNADLRQFWVNVMLNGLADTNVDFGFIDKTIKMASPFYNAQGVANDGFGKSLDLLYKSMPANKFLIGNTLRNESNGGNRSAMQVYDGSYLERWHQPHKDFKGQTEPEAMAVTIQLAREALSKGKIIIMRNTVDAYNDNGILTNADFYVPLAAFLIMVEENATISFQGSNLVYDDNNRWYTKDLEFFKNYLGPPLGDPVKNGLVYTRSFDNLDVYLDLSAGTMEECTAIFTWKGKTGPGGVTEVTGVNVSPTTASLTVGGKRQLSATVSPSNATNKSVSWTSDNALIATVSSSGLVTAVGEGIATITAKTSDGDYTANSSITVTTSAGCATFSKIEGESFNSMFGVTVGSSNDTGGTDAVKDPQAGDWVMYSGIDLTCAKSVSARVASYRIGGNIEVRLDSADGQLIGTISQGTTGSWTTWVTASANITPVIGVHDVYLVFTGGSNTTLYLNWFQFSADDTSLSTAKFDTNPVKIYPNPVTNVLNIELEDSKIAQLDLINTTGQLTLSQKIHDGKATVDLSHLSSGGYIVKITDGKKVVTSKIIKK